MEEDLISKIQRERQQELSKLLNEKKNLWKVIRDESGSPNIQWLDEEVKRKVEELSTGSLDDILSNPEKRAEYEAKEVPHVPLKVVDFSDEELEILKMKK